MLSSVSRRLNSSVPRRAASTVSEALSQGAAHQAPAGLQDPYYSRSAPKADVVPRAHPIKWPRRFREGKENQTQVPMGSLDTATTGPDQFKHTQLSQQQIKQFEEDGFLMLRSVFDSSEISQLKGELMRLNDAVQKQKPETESWHTVKEPNGDKLRSIFEVHKNSSTCQRFVHDARVVDAARQLLGDDVYIHQSRVNYQLPFVGTGFYWHSDFETWHCEDGMPLPRALSAVVLTGPNRAWNGALMLVPGSHRVYVRCPGETPEANWESSLRDKQKYGTPPEHLLEELVEKSGITYAEGDAGDVILFDSNTMHGSHNNVSPLPRSNLFTVFNAVSNQLQMPAEGTDPRPESIGVRDPAWTCPIKPRHGKITGLNTSSQEQR